MKTKFPLLLVMMCVFASPASSQGLIIGAIAGSKLVKNIIGDMSREAQQVLVTATRNGDYVMEKNLGKVDLMIKNLTYAFSKDLDKRFDQLSTFEQSAFYDVNKTASSLISQVSKEINTTREFLFMDVNNLLDNIPFLKGQKYLASIDGIGQKYKFRGFYEVSMKGTIFKFDSKDSIFINGNYLTNNYLDKSQNNVLKFDIPVNILNSKFTESDLTRVNFALKSYSQQEFVWYNPTTWFSDDWNLAYKYSSSIKLLPKLPVLSYKLLIYTDEEKWSDELFDSPTGHLLKARSPKKDQWSYDYVITTVPPGTLLVKGSETTWFQPGLAWVSIVGPYLYDDVNNSVKIMCGNQWYDHEWDFWIKCKFRKPIKYSKSTFVFLNQLNREMKGGLSFGKYTYEMPVNMKSFALELKMFNGESLTFTDYDNPTSGVEAELKNLGTDKKLLVVSVKDY